VSLSSVPLYVRILIGLVLGALVGAGLGPRAQEFDVPARIILQLLGALAPILILVAVVRAIMTAEVRGRVAWRLAGLLVLNTTVAILVGLFVANVVRPGAGVHLHAKTGVPTPQGHILSQLLENVPDSLVRPFVENRVIGVVLIALAFGVAARRLQGEERRQFETLAAAAFSLVLSVLSWIIAIVPLAVFGKVASIVGTSGFGPFVGLARFVAAVLIALVLQATYYLVRVRLGSWVGPLALVRGTRDALFLAFSTASSTVAMPVTYQRLVEVVGLRPESATLGALVGSNFNNDGTALYEAMAALFVAQMLGVSLPLGAQLSVVVTSIIASVGAAGIPEAGLVTMTLVFGAVHLPTEYIALLLTVDWFLDRCRTAINVMGDMNVSCLLEPTRPPPAPDAASVQVAKP
jgi:Na+/H+-dicarboxylate symporter